MAITRWHTDGPVRPLRRVAALSEVARVEMSRTDPAARNGLRVACAYFRQKLKKMARDRREQNDVDDTL